MQKILIFDLDGTLLDTRQDLATAVNKMRAYFCLPQLSVDRIASFIGNGIVKQTQRSVQDWQQYLSSSPNIDNAIKICNNYYQECMLQKTKPYPQVLETLAKLNEQKKFNLAVVTNKPQKLAQKLCSATDISKYIDIIIGAMPNLKLKPEPEPLLLALKKTQSMPNGSWMIGDNYTDIIAARKAGMNSCFCNYGFGNKNDEKIFFKIDNFSEILQLINES